MMKTGQEWFSELKSNILKPEKPPKGGFSFKRLNYQSELPPDESDEDDPESDGDQLESEAVDEE